MFEGSVIGAMANTVPFQVVLACAMVVSLMVWRSQKSSFFIFTILFSGMIGGGFGALAKIIPWGFTIFFGIQLVVYFWRTGSGTGNGGSLPALIAIPFYIFISVGLFYNNSYADFCLLNGIDVCSNPANWVNGFPTIWAGCINTCAITPLSFLGSSVFSSFVLAATNADYVGLITSFFTGVQSSIGSILQFIITIVSLTVGVILLMIGLGIGFSASVLASGFGITVNEAGTRFAQSFGTGLIMWSIVYGVFGGWLTAFGGGLSWGGVFSASLVVFFATMVFYGLYVQGKTVGGISG